LVLASWSLTSEVFAPLIDWGRFGYPNHPLLAFRSSPEFSHTGATVAEHSRHPVPPLRFHPLRRFPGSRQPLDPGGNQPPSSCPLSVSHALRALLHLDLPALFHAGPVLGVYPSGFFPPAEPYILSDAVALLGLACLGYATPAVRFPWPSRVGHLHQTAYCWRSPCGDKPRFRALLPASVRSRVQLFRPNSRAVTLMGFTFPRDFPLFVGALLEPSSPELFRRRAC